MQNNHINLIIISFSIILQFISALLAGRLVLLTGNRLAGIITFTAVCLMAFRRAISFYRLITGESVKIDLFAEIIALIISFLFVVGIFYITHLIIERRNAEAAQKRAYAEKEALQQSEERYKEMATRDSLTGLYNRHYFNEMIYKEIERAKRYREPLSMLLVDVDNFKEINDTYGHQHGDGVLRECASILNKAIRASDILCRFGGDEFLIVTPETDCTANDAIISRINRHISEWNEKFSSPGYELSFSIGCAVWETGKDLLEVIKEADRLMYEHKRSKK